MKGRKKTKKTKKKEQFGVQCHLLILEFEPQVIDHLIYFLFVKIGEEEKREKRKEEKREREKEKRKEKRGKRKKKRKRKKSILFNILNWNPSSSILFLLKVKSSQQKNLGRFVGGAEEERDGEEGEREGELMVMVMRFLMFVVSMKLSSLSSPSLFAFSSHCSLLLSFSLSLLFQNNFLQPEVPAHIKKKALKVPTLSPLNFFENREKRKRKGREKR